MGDLEVSLYDLVSIEDAAEIYTEKVEDIDVSVIAEVTTEESINASLSDLTITSYDLTTLSEQVEIEETQITISVYSSVSLNDSLGSGDPYYVDPGYVDEGYFEVLSAVEITIPEVFDVSIYDSVSLEEEVSGLTSDLYLSVYDEVILETETDLDQLTPSIVSTYLLFDGVVILLPDIEVSYEHADLRVTSMLPEIETSYERSKLETKIMLPILDVELII